MNLLLYFCVPLVVTGQVLVARTNDEGNERNSAKDVAGPQMSETEMYSKYEYGSHVGYKNIINDFAIGQSGEYYRRPSVEDTGEVGKPSIYNTDTGNNDHPSFIASNIYNSIRDKKNNNRGNQSSQMPSPLEYGAPTPLAYRSSTPLAYGAPTPLAYGAPTSLAYGAPTPLAYGAPTPLSYGVPTPLVHGAPAPAVEHSRVLTASQHAHNHKLQPVPKVHVQPSLSPIVQQAPVLVPLSGQHHVLLQDPHSGQLVQTPVYQDRLVPLYQPQVAPQLALYANGDISQVPIAQKVLPTYKTTDAPLRPSPAYHQAPLIHTGVVPTHSYIQKDHGEQIHVSPLLKPEISQLYHPQLLKTADVPLYQTHVLKSPNALVYQDPALKTVAPAQSVPVPVPGTEPAAVYAPLYQGPLLKGGEIPLALFKSPDGTVYQAPYFSPVHHLQSPAGHTYQVPVHQYPVPSHVVLKDTVQPQPLVLNDLASHAILKASGARTLQKQALKAIVPALQQHIFKAPSGPFLIPPLLKSHNAEAAIVPAIEEPTPTLHHAPSVVLKAHLTQPQLAQYFSPQEAVEVTPRQPKVLIQKAALYKAPALIEKSVLKNTLSPVSVKPVVNIQKAIYKAPLHATFVDSRGHVGPNLSANILSSHKAVVNALISADTGKLYRGGAAGLFANAAKIELVPSLSYGYSYSLYPKANGLYGPPQQGRAHIK